jgi:hypothetical protein
VQRCRENSKAAIDSELLAKMVLVTQQAGKMAHVLEGALRPMMADLHCAAKALLVLLRSYLGM